LVAIIVAFALVYSGTAYPGDAAGGLLLGTLVSLALYPFAIGSLRDLAHAVARSPLKVLVGGGHHGGAVGPGPASRPTLVGESGAVRILSPEEVRAGRTKPSGHAGPARILPPGQTGTGSILPPDETGGISILPPRDAGSGSGAGTARS
jgi:hypothetical protein